MKKGRTRTKTEPYSATCKLCGAEFTSQKAVLDHITGVHNLSQFENSFGFVNVENLLTQKYKQIRNRKSGKLIKVFR